METRKSVKRTTRSSWKQEENEAKFQIILKKAYDSYIDMKSPYDSFHYMVWREFRKFQS